MPFLLPIVSGILGIGQSVQSSNQQKKALNIQDQVAQQEMGDKQQIFDLLKPFFQQYLGQGSPFLSMIQRAGAEQNAQQFNNSAGQLRSTMQTSGLGFGPSGATAAAVGGLGAESAKNASATFLDNLLKNEQIKFQAAQGLNSVGSMAGSSQNQPGVNIGIQGTPTGSIGSSVGALGQVLNGILNPGGRSSGSGGSAPGVGLPLAPTVAGLFP